MQTPWILWIKALHVIFMVTWFAGLFYLPRLFVYHAMSSDAPSIERFKVMERKLFFGIMTPGALLTVIFGLTLLVYFWSAYKHMGWLHVKLALVVLLLVYHGWCGKLLADFKHDRNTRSHRWYRVFNEVPILLLFGIVIMVLVRPF
jgi:protoporphyrinogen IX oxidase